MDFGNIIDFVPKFLTLNMRIILYDMGRFKSKLITENPRGNTKIDSDLSA